MSPPADKSKHPTHPRPARTHPAKLFPFFQLMDIQGFNRECGPDDGNVFFVIPINDIRPAINATELLNIQPGYPLPAGAEFFRSRYICQQTPSQP